MLEKICRDNLIAVARAYSKATGLSLEQISARFYGNTVFLRDYQRGTKTISLKLYDRMWGEFVRQWPEGGVFPFPRSVVFDRPERQRRKTDKTIINDNYPAPH